MDNTVWIKCAYSKGLFPNEYVVKVPALGGDESYLVNRKDVLTLDKEKGLLKSQILDTDNSKALVSIIDAGDKGLSYAAVSLDNIVRTP